MSTTARNAPRRSNRNAKVIAATGAAVLLLTAGAGSFARWSDGTDLVGGTIASGQLTIDTVSEGWTDAEGKQVENPAAYLMIPGSTLHYKAVLDVQLEGENLVADLTTDPSVLTGDTELLNALEIETALDGSELDAPFQGVIRTGLTQSGQHDLEATVNFPLQQPDGSNWGTIGQNQTVDLTKFDVTLTQTTAQQ